MQGHRGALQTGCAGSHQFAMDATNLDATNLQKRVIYIVDFI
jgi:hypothetical protein